MSISNFHSLCLQLCFRFEVQPWTASDSRRARDGTSAGGLGLGLGLSSKSPSPTRSQSQSDVENVDDGGSSRDHPRPTFLDNGVVRSATTAFRGGGSSHSSAGTATEPSHSSQSHSRHNSSHRRHHSRSPSQSHLLLPTTYTEGGPMAEGANATIIPGPLLRRAVSASVQQGRDRSI